MESRRYIPYMTISLIVINVLIFLIETVAGGSESTEVALKFGAQYAPYVIGEGEWYRTFTSMFVHFGIEHIFGNMIALV
ncbi:MAG: rhomboid family intramembrane serine protease, partial [Eubacterium sp.]|nr:rhomboid family intramembrane serine protease [Eubacterium sp.]